MAYINPGTDWYEPRYAGFWLRVGATLIDGIILSVVYAIVGALTGIEKVNESFVGAVLGWLYCALMESSKHQATLGKLVLGLAVTDMNGERISFWRATVRHFAMIISALILMIGFMMAGWTAKKQALHDIIADTLVIVR
ncbi:MAG: RDD family protein [Mycobacterium leprae]